MELMSFQKLFQMTKVINSQFELSEILQVFVDAIAGEITQADLVGFFLKQPDGTFKGYKGNKLPVDITELLIDPKEDEFVRDILRNQSSDYISDTSVDLRLDQSKRQLLKIKSILGIPVIVDNEVFGLVFVHDFGKPMNITPEQMEVTEAFVNMASVAIRNIRMFEQRQLLMEKQQLLLDATKALSESLSVKDVLNTFFHYMRKASGSKDIGIHLYNEKEHTIEPYQLSSENVTMDEWKVKHREVKLTIENDRLLYEVITEKKSAAIEDVYADPRPNHKAFVSFDIKSIMVFPLVAKGSVYGVVAIPSIGKQRKYEASLLEFCQSISDATATALSNAQHTETLDHSVHERSIELQQANFKLEGLVRELEHLNELKSDFIATLSHELRTPITAVKGSVDILGKGILGDLNDSQKDLLDIAAKSIDRLLDQVNELLDFAKMENGKFELMYTEADFNEIVKESVHIVQSLINKKKLVLVVETEVDKDTVVRVDKQRILQILLNLLSNAIKFTPPLGVITIRTKFEDSLLTVEVHDNGIGIPFEKQKNIFTKFYQANNQINGTGLGLAISKQLIELHGGRIWFESSEGQGSVFKFTLPTGKE
ncbi:GAF domain-containing sensor histidine kinase [Paenibacillus aceris]|uniref:histidine kinase n=1 Tax=Paenibacillus aceris TaxID=869555 RepID=A0ABS4I8P2_9BACL|nr:ATP-binding protein [Paenibacillus aceris]MBP1967306.1 signal transduction histidine kinase [Paenibacillus aceris]NHW38034.1 GAF domain-containing protein [Paenibacillus aceris]